MNTPVNIWVLALAATIVCAPAAAAIKVATYTGTIAEGGDITGVFGTAGTDLTDQAFVARFRYNTALGRRETTPGVVDTLYGGSFYNTTTSLLSATITINGVTRHFELPDSDSDITILNGFMEHYVSAFFFDGSTYIYNIIDFQSYPTGNQASLDANLPSQSSDYTTGLIQFEFDDPNTGAYESAYGRVDSYNFTVSITDGVPDAPAWAMLIAGFGIVGAAARRRREIAA
jgi:hypothetical protein